MNIVLSQRIDYSSDYDDIPFVKYHYPARYRNQISEGCKFLYYQGNRNRRDQRYYFGAGIVGKIQRNEDDSYTADLSATVRFPSPVPIYTADGSFYESIAFESIRNQPNPSWQNSVRKISNPAFLAIVSESGVDIDEISEYAKVYQSESPLASLEALNRQYAKATPNNRQSVARNLLDRGTRISNALKEILGAVCQVCGFVGFEKADGSRYIEAHHVSQLSEMRPSALCVENILLLCPNCHREIHYGKSVEIDFYEGSISVRLERVSALIPVNTVARLRDGMS